ncbi:MAG: glycogen synthase GlgA [Gammaproteobacteria bacterium]|nr:MAG: glycogen synthase GlgA [Gammaproteobacteria bacterium]
MKILHVASEMFPLLKTGGLADVVGALPFAQQQIGDEARILLPAYPAMLAAMPSTALVCDFDSFAGKASLRYADYHGVGIYLLEAAHLFDREGNPYHDADYQDYSDNYLRFALLAYTAAEIAEGLDTWWRPEVVHAHDWHSGLTPAYLYAKGSQVRTIFTIHNIAYQGLFASQHLPEIALPEYMMSVEGIEFHDQLSYLKAGIYYANQVTTVSPTYAREIITEENGFGLQGLLQSKAEQGQLSGVLNGVDESIWNPLTDSYLKNHYKIGNMQGKAKNKAALQKQFNLTVDKHVLLTVMVSRLTEQKGVDLLIDSIATIIKNNGQLIVLGSGNPVFEKALLQLAEKYPAYIGVCIGYDEALSHLLVAGGDVIAVPSRFEPCGLTQLYGLKYGTLPLVHRTGGLADTVEDSTETAIKVRSATGFVFDSADSDALSRAMCNMFSLWKNPGKWHSVRANAMRTNFSWQLAAEQYQVLYR